MILKIKEILKEFWRRQKWFWMIPAIGAVWLILTNSELLIMTLKVVMIGYAAIGLAYVARKTLIKADLGDHLESAQQGNVASGLVVLAISVFYCVAVWVFAHAILS